MKKHPHGRGEDLLPVLRWLAMKETPPRAWGRLQDTIETSVGVGNTPTGVGKTLLTGVAMRLTQKHPHGRGEDTATKLFALE